ncbi:DUF551 domain-containing protein [Escherichia marmotae]|nr:DUF551 domain-containing protein [Escherichia marmotae]
MRNHLAVFERYGIAPNDSSTTIHALRIALDGIERSDAMLHGAEPVSQTYKLPVNTPCKDAPAHIWLQTAGVWPEDGELSELTWCSHNQHHDDTLYVRADLVNGNSPVTPDGWISCSERMPEIRQTVIGWNGYAVRQCVYTRNEYAKTQKGREPRFETLTGIWHGVTHWMPLP